MKLELLYITPDFIDLSVFMSQIHDLLEAHSKNYNVTLVAFGSSNEIAKDNSLNSTYNLVIIPKKKLTPLPFYHRKFLKNKELLKVLKRADIIHCRSHYATSLATRWKQDLNLKTPIIGDIRGAVVEEILESSIPLRKVKAWIFRKEEKKIFNKADYLFLMSDKMHRYYSINLKYQMPSYSIFPTIVDDKKFRKNPKWRDAIRKKYNIGNRYTYIYIGGLSYWQNVHLMLRYFRKNTYKRENNFCFILASRDIEELCNLIKLENDNIIPSNIIPLQLEHKEIPMYLNGADAGVIIRSESPVNYVASPTKINEYAACGLKICSSLDQIGNLNASLEEAKIKPMSYIIREQDLIYKRLTGKI